MKVTWHKIKKYNINNNYVHVWFVDIKKNLGNLAYFTGVLSEEEKERACRFKFEKDQNLFIVSHAILRILLEKYLNVSLNHIKFKNNEYGKPTLDLENNNLFFNLTHSKSYALIAFNKNQPIGIDIEQLKEVRDSESIVKRFFSEREYEEYKGLPDDEKLAGFYNVWTKKEAFVKATGKGIYYSFKNFEVSLSNCEKISLLSVDRDKNEALNWQLYGFIPEDNCCAAVCWRGEKKELFFYEFLG